MKKTFLFLIFLSVYFVIEASEENSKTIPCLKSIAARPNISPESKNLLLKI